ncbi:MAG: Smr/MutS family protein [Gammaproteobacteria bacterium]|nr:Smr/MutS family protein [Gammaproteobacteria bacterium]
MSKRDDKNLPDEELFRNSLSGVQPLKSDKVPLQAPKPKPLAKFSRADNEKVLEESLQGPVEEEDDSLFFARPGLQNRVVRKLRRGQLSVAAELDLHGLTVEKAKSAITAFLRDAIDAGYRCVRIIHGKGYGSGSRGPILKLKIPAWLRKRNEVLAFCSARPVDGGTGALYVLLRKT